MALDKGTSRTAGAYRIPYRHPSNHGSPGTINFNVTRSRGTGIAFHDNTRLTTQLTISGAQPHALAGRIEFPLPLRHQHHEHLTPLRHQMHPFSVKILQARPQCSLRPQSTVRQNFELGTRKNSRQRRKVHANFACLTFWPPGQLTANPSTSPSMREWNVTFHNEPYLMQWHWNCRLQL